MAGGCSLGSPAVSEGKHQVLRKLLLSATDLGRDLVAEFRLEIEEQKIVHFMKLKTSTKLQNFLSFFFHYTAV